MIFADLSYVYYEKIREYLNTQGYPILYCSRVICSTRSLLSQIIIQRMNIRMFERGVAIDFDRFFGQINYYFHSNQVYIFDFLIEDINLLDVSIIFRADGTPSGILSKPFNTFGCSFVYKGFELKFTTESIDFWPLVLLYVSEKNQKIFEYWLERAKTAFEKARVEKQLKLGLDGGSFIKWEGNACPMCPCVGKTAWESCTCKVVGKIYIFNFYYF